MYAPMSVICAVDVVGAVIVIALSFYSLYLMRGIYKRRKGVGLYIYLYYQTVALAVFAVSRSVGHVAKHVLIALGYADVWKALAPVSGSINSFTFIVFGLAALMYANIRSVSERVDSLEKTGRELKSSRELTMRSLEEKEILLKEVHHRVKNNLAIISSLLTMQSRKMRGVQSIRAFEDSRNRIMSMALIHEKLYQSEDLRSINVREYFVSLVHKLMHSYGISDDSVGLEMDITVESMEIDTLIPCGLIINELVSNSLKYAFLNTEEGVINITFKVDGEYMKLDVSDNGDGLPKKLDVDSVGSLGLQIVGALVNQLEGELEIDRSIGTGFKIRFPYATASTYLED